MHTTSRNCPIFAGPNRNVLPTQKWVGAVAAQIPCDLLLDSVH
jgi:hypothetical protein